MSLNYQDSLLTIGAIAFDEVVDFYRQLLEQSPQPFQTGIYAEFRINSLRLGIFKPKADHQSEFATSLGSGFSLCLEVENLEQAIAHLQAIGYPPKNPITTASHGREVYSYDPAGNRLILHESPLTT